MRERVSLLLGHGHPQAFSYPLGLLTQETEFVVARLNRQEATRATLLRLAVSSVRSEDAAKAFTKATKALQGEE